MFNAKNRSGIPIWAGNWSRIAVTAVLGWSTTIYPVLAQTPPAATEQPAPAPRELPTPPSNAAAASAAAQATDETYTLSELEYLLGPIALFPDTLLALVFPAAAQPDQILDAAKWLDDNAEAVKNSDFSGVDGKGWDTSVQALTRFPDVIQMLAGHLDWTESLGAAFNLQPDDVATAIQLLRAQAEKVGNLKTTEQQVVSAREEGGKRTIYIAPANPERIYVPTYDSSTVFTTAAVGALAFTTGVLVGSSWNNRWGWNNRSWNTVWVYRPGWHRPPNWHRPPPHRPPGSWRPDRPNRPGRPDRPNRPGRPDRPGVRPDRPGDRPGLRPDRPGVRPERPGRPDRPGVRPDRPGTRPERPNVRPDRPNARPERPGNTNRPNANRPNNNRPNANRPSNNRPNANRPSNRPNANRQQARPSRQQARPRQNVQRSPQRARSGNNNARRPQQNVPRRNR
ncbi:DUF3300 domain-containing protein [Starkeya sp. ORNL1]|uniref:DUF3300 domain-containing protein n=1 Tax=Starkeya sp. ORNL1 TaxID=2709380 RepID=UPI0014646B2B|nr:DUF3300 domain-containing protein [Starkeya sp. ORNL1]QJP14060.1 DUF3300 domain-containing protein [Starkeya sp. ORNL1]